MTSKAKTNYLNGKLLKKWQFQKRTTQKTESKCQCYALLKKGIKRNQDDTWQVEVDQCGDGAQWGCWVKTKFPSFSNFPYKFTFTNKLINFYNHFLQKLKIYLYIIKEVVVYGKTTIKMVTKFGSNLFESSPIVLISKKLKSLSIQADKLPYALTYYLSKKIHLKYIIYTTNSLSSASWSSPWLGTFSSISIGSISRPPYASSGFSDRGYVAFWLFDPELDCCSITMALNCWHSYSRVSMH